MTHDVEMLRAQWVAVVEMLPEDQLEIALAAGVTVPEIEAWAKGAELPAAALDALAAALGEYDFAEGDEPEKAKAANGADDDAAEFSRKWQQQSEELHGHRASTGRTYDELIAAAKAMTKATSLADIKQVLTDAAFLKPKIGGLEGDELIAAIHDATGRGKRALNKSWDEIFSKIAEAEKPSAEEAAAAYEANHERMKAAAEAAKAEAAAAKEAERARLEAVCKDIMHRTDLMDYHIDLVTRQGIVGEEEGKATGVLLIYGRLGANPFSVVRDGNLAAGKNILLEKVFVLCPDGAVIEVSGGSDKWLVYYGDENALRFKILFFTEAAGTIAVKTSGEESVSTVAIRTILSGGHFKYWLTKTDPETKESHSECINKWGPTPVAVTTARNNIEKELLSRMVAVGADESAEQTRYVRRSNAADVKKSPLRLSPTEAEIEEVKNYQRLLELDCGYKVVIPFAEAVDVLLGPTVEIGIRRDCSAIHNAIRASTILHKYQRKIDADGDLIATYADYRNMVRAIGPAITAKHRTHIDPRVLAVVEMIEAAADKERAKMQAQRDATAGGMPDALKAEPVKISEVLVTITYKEILAALGINSDDALKKRIDAAVTHHIIARAPSSTGGRNAPMSYRILVSSAELRQQIEVERLLPTIAEVKALMADPDKLTAELKALAAIDAAREAKKKQEWQWQNGDIDDDGGV